MDVVLSYVSVLPNIRQALQGYTILRLPDQLLSPLPPDAVENEASSSRRHREDDPNPEPGRVAHPLVVAEEWHGEQSLPNVSMRNGENPWSLDGCSYRKCCAW